MKADLHFTFCILFHLLNIFKVIFFENQSTILFTKSHQRKSFHSGVNKERLLLKVPMKQFHWFVENMLGICKKWKKIFPSQMQSWSHLNYFSRFQTNHFSMIAMFLKHILSCKRRYHHLYFANNTQKRKTKKKI